MFRLLYVIFINFFRIVYYVPKMSYISRHRDRYSEDERYALAQKLILTVMRTARVETEYSGVENLPQSGGYIMFSNHQGRYDPIGILSGHKLPCSFVIDKKRADQFLVRQFASLLDGISIDKESSKSQINALKALSKRAEEGRRCLVFPEGIYEKKQGNRTGEFKKGCFIGATHAKCPIVPVTIVDSYKVFSGNSMKRITTKVIYHKPILYEEYKNLKTCELGALVKDVIDRELAKYEK